MSTPSPEFDGTGRRSRRHHVDPVTEEPGVVADHHVTEERRVVDETDVHEPSADVAPATRDAHRPATTDPVGGGKLGSAWVALVVGAVITVVLLVFVVQNNHNVETRFFGWEFSLPQGVQLLLAAIAGALIMALFAGVRILQLRMRARRTPTR